MIFALEILNFSKFITYFLKIVGPIYVATPATPSSPNQVIIFEKWLTHSITLWEIVSVCLPTYLC